MKKITLVLILLSCIISACKKSVIKATTLPAPINMEIIGKDGKSMVTSKSDSITISYTENGVVKSFHPLILSLKDKNEDSTVLNYNGLIINDNAVMSDLSSQTNAIHSFNISLNGIGLGVIYVDYWKYEAAFPAISSPAFTFNNVPVIEDQSTAYYLPGSDINLLQIK